MCLILFNENFLIFLIHFYIYFDFWTRKTNFLEQFMGCDKILKKCSNHMEKPSRFEQKPNFLYEMQILVKIYVTAFPMCLVLFLESFMIFLISFYIYFDFWTRNTYFLEQFVGHDKILKNSSNHMEKPSGFEVLVPKKNFF